MFCFSTCKRADQTTDEQARRQDSRLNLLVEIEAMIKRQVEKTARHAFLQGRSLSRTPAVEQRDSFRSTPFEF